MPLSLFDLVAKKLETVPNVHDSGLLRVKRNSKPVVKEPLRESQSPPSLVVIPTDHYEVIRPTRQVKSLSHHRSIEWSQKDVRSKRTRYPTLRNASHRRLPISFCNHSTSEDLANQLKDTTIADLLGD